MKGAHLRRSWSRRSFALFVFGLCLFGLGIGILFGRCGPGAGIGRSHVDHDIGVDNHRCRAACSFYRSDDHGKVAPGSKKD
jgi:hypothetical protein